LTGFGVARCYTFADIYRDQMLLISSNFYLAVKMEGLAVGIQVLGGRERQWKIFMILRH